MIKKPAGISLIMAIFMSTIMLGVVFSIVVLMYYGITQVEGFETSNKVFFMSEAGKEAGIFHHNARGQGIDSIDDEKQKLEFDNEMETTWNITGRNKTGVLTGILAENQKISIPLFYDNGKNVGENLSETIISNDDFELKFSRNNFDENGNENNIDEIIPSGFDFGKANGQGKTNDNEVLINWSISRICTNTFSSGCDEGSVRTFIPRSKLTDENKFCEEYFASSSSTQSGFFCENHLDGPNYIDSDSSDIIGYVVPGQTEMDLSEFYNKTDYKYSLHFEAILPFTSSDGNTKIRGIPWALDFNNTLELPTPYFEVSTTANMGDFSKTQTSRIWENVSDDFDIFKAE